MCLVSEVFLCEMFNRAVEYVPHRYDNRKFRMSRWSTAILLPLLLSVESAHADAMGWQDERFNMVVRDQNIRDVLVQFGALAGVPVVLSEDVDARVTARFENATGEEIVEAIAREYALDWRYDGRRIEVSANSEQVSRILDMGGVAKADLVRALEALGAHEPRFPITAVDGQLALLVGPPRYVGIVEIVLAELVETRAAAEARAAERRRKAEAEEKERLEKAEAEDRERREKAERLAERLRIEERERLAEERRLRVQAFEREKQVRTAPAERTTPLINRGGRWGG